MPHLRDVIAARHHWAAPCYALVLALAICAPLYSAGYLLLRDAVSTPRSYLSDAALGLTEAAPRALPQDAAVALSSTVLDGGVLVKALLVLGLFAAGFGAARLVAQVLPEAGLPGQFVAVTLAIWNPYVAERLLQGHWSLLVGYGCLPWVAGAMVRLRRGQARSGWSLAFWTALAGLTPTGLLMATAVALVCVAIPANATAEERRWRHAAASLGLAAAVAMPWLAASALGPAPASSANGIAAFAARAEPGLGTLGSLAALGGIWNADAVPASRDTLFALVGSAVLVAVVVLGLPIVRRRPAALVLVLLALAAVVLPAAMASGPGIAALEALVRVVPGLGVLRDGQKWVGLAMPGYAVAGAAAVVTLRHRARPAVTAGVCAVALIAVLPDLAWGVGGTLRSVQYPADWPAATAIVNADPAPVAVLPADSMRRFSWATGGPVLDPLPRWVTAHVLVTGDLRISGETVLGEGSRAREVQELLLSGTDAAGLTRAGVGWVVVEKTSHGDMGSAAELLAQFPVVFRGADLTLYRVGGDTAGASHARRAVLIAAHLLWLAVLVIGAVGMVVPRRD